MKPRAKVPPYRPNADYGFVLRTADPRKMAAGAAVFSHAVCSSVSIPRPPLPHRRSPSKSWTRPDTEGVPTRLNSPRQGLVPCRSLRIPCQCLLPLLNLWTCCAYVRSPRRRCRSAAAGMCRPRRARRARYAALTRTYASSAGGQRWGENAAC